LSGGYPTTHGADVVEELETVARRRVPLPWIETTPLTDLTLGLVCIPLWWVLGIEQMVWAPIGFIALAKVVTAQRGRLLVPPFALWSILFLMAHAASGLFIVEGMRVLTFGRNFGAYVGATLWVLVLVNTVHSLRDARKVLVGSAVAMTLAGFLGLLGIAGVWRGVFTSPIGLVLPDAITSTTYGGQIATRSTGGPAWFLGLGNYYRVNSFFLFPTMFATAIAVTLPIVLWLQRTGRRPYGRRAWLLCAALLLVNLPFTTGRIATGSLIAGGAWFFLMKHRKRSVVVSASLVILAAAVIVNRELSSLASTGVEAAAYARGLGSVDTRGQVYRSTIEGFFDRPLLGWGTERDVRDQRYPAGSHSTYLGVLYKHGVVGFACLLGVLASAWITTRPGGIPKDTPEHALLRFSQWTLVVVLLNGLTDAIDLDATTLVLIYVVVGTAVAVRRLPRSPAGFLA
jgi:hypothetical protein